ncbi:rcc01693 family protein [Rhizobium sp. Leaf371]|uniref:rcc01693 family protein n=1 Tax=Rhizobium sp. Leaf371 TaxID=1736355 RepID=UPI0009E6BE36|nr:rcc01693 family protein [Rhizobium sp. Leaf371]
MTAAGGEESAAPAPFPWEAVMAAGLSRLRLPARDFWRMTPRELAAALGLSAGRGGAPDRAGLARMMRQFPDDAA